MNKRVRINFTETSKEIKADVSIEYTTPVDGISNEEILAETSQLFEEALKKATLLTRNKVLSGK